MPDVEPDGEPYGNRPGREKRMNKWEWETCDCSSKFDGWGDPTICGCGTEVCRLYRRKTIHWLDKHWRLECAFDHATMLLQERGEDAKNNSKI